MTFSLVFSYTHNYRLVHVTTYITFAEEDDVAGISIAQGLTICIPRPNPTKNQLHKHINSLKPSLHLVILLRISQHHA